MGITETNVKVIDMKLGTGSGSESGLKANTGKSVFFRDRVTFCGHVIDKEDLHKSEDKTVAILNVPIMSVNLDLFWLCLLLFQIHT